jgi:methyl-accepting chemotaxis protein
MRHAATQSRSTACVEHVLAFSALVATAGTAGGAYLSRSGHGWQAVLYAASGALLVCALAGLWAQDRIMRLQRGELARAYTSALQGQRDHAAGPRGAQASRLETLGHYLASLIESTRLVILRRDGLAGWAAAIRTGIEQRQRDAQRLAGTMAEDAHLIAEAAAGTRRGETETADRLAQMRGRTSASAAATDAAVCEATQLADAIRALTVNTERATSLAIRMAETAFTTQRGVATIADTATALLHAADQVRHVLRRAELLGVSAGIEAAGAGEAGRGFAMVATEMKSLAATGGAALDALLTAVRELKSESSQIAQRVQEVSDVVAAQHEFGHALAHAATLQADAVGRLLRQLGHAQGELRGLYNDVHTITLPDTRLGAAAQQAVERLPSYAEAMAQILRGLPDFSAIENNWQAA